jgi:hypothetical protein
MSLDIFKKHANSPEYKAGWNAEVDNNSGFKLKAPYSGKGSKLLNEKFLDGAFMCRAAKDEAISEAIQQRQNPIYPAKI